MILLWSLHILPMPYILHQDQPDPTRSIFSRWKTLWQLTSSVSDHTRGECKSCCGVLQPSAAVHVEAFFVVVKCWKWQGIFIIFHLQIRDDTSSNHQWINMNQFYRIGASSRNIPIVASNKIQRCWKMSRLSRVERSLRSAHCHMFFQSCACRIARTWAQPQHDSMT